MVQQGKIRFIHSAVLVKKKVVTHMAVTTVDLADIVDLVAMVTVEEAVDTVEGVVDIAEEVVMTIAEAGTVGEVVLDTICVWSPIRLYLPPASRQRSGLFGSVSGAHQRSL